MTEEDEENAEAGVLGDLNTGLWEVSNAGDEAPEVDIEVERNAREDNSEREEIRGDSPTQPDSLSVTTNPSY